MLVSELKKALLNHQYDGILNSIYLDDQAVKKQVIRYSNALSSFEKMFANEDVSIFSAPGRSEIGGNHTDHQHGKVIAAAINLDVIAIVAFNESKLVNMHCEGFEVGSVDINELDVKETEVGKTEALIRGVCAKFNAMNMKISGFNAFVTSDVLGGSGLSSSAAFETLVGSILSYGLNDGAINAIQIAQIGQYAENVYFKKPCGLMDQMASSVGGFVAIDFKDVNNPLVEKIDFDFIKTGYHLCIIDTQGSHSDLTDEYAAVPSEMKQVATFFNKDFLSEISEEMLYEHISELREQVSDRAVLRAIHYFNDCANVEKEVEALKANDFNTFKKLISISGNSSYRFLQNVFSTKDLAFQGVSMAIALSEHYLKDKGVCRVHGGGFAGTIQAFVASDMLDKYKEAMEKVFGEGTCYVLNVRPVGGMKVI